MSTNLTTDEAKVILENLKAMTVKSILTKPTLLSAVMKLNGTPLHEPGMGMPFAGGSSAPSNRWKIAGHKIELIKTLRHLLGLGLKESKDEVERLDPNGRGFIIFDAQKYHGIMGFNEARAQFTNVEIYREEI